MDGVVDAAARLPNDVVQVCPVALVALVQVHLSSLSCTSQLDGELQRLVDQFDRLEELVGQSKLDCLVCLEQFVLS